MVVELLIAYAVGRVHERLAVKGADPIDKIIDWVTGHLKRSTDDEDTPTVDDIPDT